MAYNEFCQGGREEQGVHLLKPNRGGCRSGMQFTQHEGCNYIIRGVDTPPLLHASALKRIFFRR